MTRITDISNTVFRGLGIGVLAGVSGGVMRSMDKAFGWTKPRRKRSKRKKRR